MKWYSYKHLRGWAILRHSGSCQPLWRCPTNQLRFLVGLGLPLMHHLVCVPPPPPSLTLALLGWHPTQVTARLAPTLCSNSASAERPSQTTHTHPKALPLFSLCFFFYRIWHYIVFGLFYNLPPPLDCKFYKNRDFAAFTVTHPESSTTLVRSS